MPELTRVLLSNDAYRARAGLQPTLRPLVWTKNKTVTRNVSPDNQFIMPEPGPSRHTGIDGPRASGNLYRSQDSHVTSRQANLPRLPRLPPNVQPVLDQMSSQGLLSTYNDHNLRPAVQPQVEQCARKRPRTSFAEHRSEGMHIARGNYPAEPAVLPEVEHTRKRPRNFPAEDAYEEAPLWADQSGEDDSSAPEILHSIHHVEEQQSTGASLDGGNQVPVQNVRRPGRTLAMIVFHDFLRNGGAESLERSGVDPDTWIAQWAEVFEFFWRRNSAGQSSINPILL